jgi:hypothetical protein
MYIIKLYNLNQIEQRFLVKLNIQSKWLMIFSQNDQWHLIKIANDF